MSDMIVAALLIPLIIILLFSTAVLCMDLLNPYIYYSKISDISRQYLMSIENNGGLSATDRANLLEALVSRGISADDITIDAVPAVGETAGYGEPISITITYCLDLKLLSVGTDGASLSFSKKSRIFSIKVSKTGISKLVQ